VLLEVIKTLLIFPNINQQPQNQQPRISNLGEYSYY